MGILYHFEQILSISFRLESGNANPTVEFLEKITLALGQRLVIQVL